MRFMWEKEGSTFYICLPVSSKFFHDRLNIKQIQMKPFFSSRSLLATGSSKGVVQLYDVNQSAMTQIEAPKDFSSHKALLSGLKFDPGNDNIIYVSRVSGECSSFDLRSNEVTYKYSDDSNGALKTFTCIDVNQNSRILCCGTEKIRGDAFLLFFETRQRKLLGGYWESHEDDITNVSFIYKR